MNHYMKFDVIDKKVIIRIKEKICDTSEELLSSKLFKVIVKRCINQLSDRDSILLDIFKTRPVSDAEIDTLIAAYNILYKMPADTIPNIIPASATLFEKPALFHEFTEYLYNFWRSYFRIIICDSEGDRLDRRPYRTFNLTIQQLTSTVRRTYRDAIENLTGKHPQVYRQVIAGAEIATIALPRDIPYPALYKELNVVPIIRQVLLHPPLIMDPPMNKRTGSFKKVDKNPMDLITVNKKDWLCYPAKVGDLLVFLYMHKSFYELGLSLCNLFELAGEADFTRKPDAVYIFGVEADLQDYYGSPTIFHDDTENDILVAAAPNHPDFGYFGYIKKMMLTLYNAKKMKNGLMPFHGALVKIILNGGVQANVLIIGDSGAGKSETLTALDEVSEGNIQDMVVIADDMGSIDFTSSKNITGYGTEIGAFLRLDDLTPGFAFGQIDRAIIMNPNKVNARIILPVATYENIIKGVDIDIILYANNYDVVDESHPIIEQFHSAKEAISVFRQGKVASKGTTTTTGIIQSYFANIFGPPDYTETHDRLADECFNKAFDMGIFVGQMRTRLGVPGFERTGPIEAAKVLLKTIMQYNKTKKKSGKPDVHGTNEAD